jgi:hypothetical protein
MAGRNLISDIRSATQSCSTGFMLIDETYSIRNKIKKHSYLVGEEKQNLRVVSNKFVVHNYSLCKMISSYF